MGTTNILDLNNRLSKVEKENVAQNSYTSLKNKPKINNVTLTGNKSLADIGAAAAADLGELTDLTTTDKSSCVGAINEVNGFFVNLGVITANDWTNFFKNACAAFHALNPKTYVAHNVFLSWGGTRYCGQFIDYGDAVDFTITGGGGATLYCGYSLLAGAGETKFHKYVEYIEGQTLLNIDSAYNAGTDWNIVKQGNICVMNMRDLKDLPNGNTLIGTIPEGFRPVNEFYEYVYSPNKQTHLGFIFSTNGEVTAINSTGSTLSDEIYANRNVVYFTN